mmetsp:Transcript_91622/g.203380  ORF Transcript_91622/g.203380 Transcript_91622/m.203380 type:complete len:212 (+) Transcript_91622:3021-3656(+)
MTVLAVPLVTRVGSRRGPLGTRGRPLGHFVAAWRRRWTITRSLPSIGAILNEAVQPSFLILRRSCRLGLFGASTPPLPVLLPIAPGGVQGLPLAATLAGLAFGAVRALAPWCRPLLLLPAPLPALTIAWRLGPSLLPAVVSGPIIPGLGCLSLAVAVAIAIAVAVSGSPLGRGHGDPEPSFYATRPSGPMRPLPRPWAAQTLPPRALGPRA